MIILSIFAGVTASAVVVAAAIALRRSVPLAARVRRALRRRSTWLVALPAYLCLLAVVVPLAFVTSLRRDAPPPLEFSTLPVTETTGTDGSTSSTDPPTEAEEPAPASGLPSGEERGATSTSLDAGPTAEATEPVAPPASTTATVPPNPVEGTWVVGSGSVAGYRVSERVLGVRTPVVGRTDEVGGELRIEGTTVTASHVEVDMASVRCGCSHDAKYPELLDTRRHRTSTFVLTSPIELEAVPEVGQVVAVVAGGDITIRGTTRSVTVELEARRTGDRIEVIAAIPVRLSQHGIHPDRVPGLLRVEDRATIELQLFYGRTS